MNKNKKKSLLLSLGLISTITTFSPFFISCNQNSEMKKEVDKKEEQLSKPQENTPKTNDKNNQISEKPKPENDKNDQSMETKPQLENDKNNQKPENPRSENDKNNQSMENKPQPEKDDTSNANDKKDDSKKENNNIDQNSNNSNPKEEDKNKLPNLENKQDDSKKENNSSSNKDNEELAPLNLENLIKKANFESENYFEVKDQNLKIDYSKKDKLENDLDEYIKTYFNGDSNAKQKIINHANNAFKNDGQRINSGISYRFDANKYWEKYDESKNTLPSYLNVGISSSEPGSGSILYFGKDKVLISTNAHVVEDWPKVDTEGSLTFNRNNIKGTIGEYNDKQRIEGKYNILYIDPKGVDFALVEFVFENDDDWSKFYEVYKNIYLKPTEIVVPADKAVNQDLFHFNGFSAEHIRTLFSGIFWAYSPIRAGKYSSNHLAITTSHKGDSGSGIYKKENGKFQLSYILNSIAFSQGTFPEKEFATARKSTHNIFYTGIIKINDYIKEILDKHIQKAQKEYKK